jgi:hypothetical protein
MTEVSSHDASVNRWMERVKDLPPDELVRAFETGFGAMWQRAQRTLGDITLTAIVDRVLYVAGERFPMFTSVRMDGSGLRAEDLHRRASILPRDQLTNGVRFFLVEFLTVLGNLSANILTPALHAELAKAAVDGETGPNGESRRKTGTPKANHIEGE